jgi:uncharacterized protein (DUF2267 family)
MPMPMEYCQASKDFDAFLNDVRETCMLTSLHQAYHTVRAVLHTFRAHLDVQAALNFAQVLPPVVRAIFVEDWTVVGEPEPFPDRRTLVSEVKSIRRDHNLAPDTAIEDVAAALRRCIDNAALDRALAYLPEGAAAFWSPEGNSR